MKRLARQLLLLSLLGTLVSSCASHIQNLSPCLGNPQEDYKDVVTIIGEAQCYSKNAFINQPITDAISQVPIAKQKPVVAVYRFGDATGQRKSVDGYANFSTALTQAPETYFAGLIMEGAIVDYNTNLLTGGIGARYLGVGSSKQYREDTIVVSLRVVSVGTGEILIENLTTKTILSVGLSNDFFRYIADGTKLVEFETGNAMNESKSIALQAAIETGIVDIINQGNSKGYWRFIGE